MSSNGNEPSISVYGRATLIVIIVVFLIFSAFQKDPLVPSMGMIFLSSAGLKSISGPTSKPLRSNCQFKNTLIQPFSAILVTNSLFSPLLAR